jgi:hypothetical protein
MPERSDNYEDLVPYHRRNKSDVELAFDDYIELVGHTNPTLMEAYISGWNQHKYLSGKMYTIEEVKEIVN